MPASDYWYGDPWLAAGYRRADELNRQRKSAEMWMQGAYFFEALNVVFANVLAKKGQKPQKYLEEPYRIIPYTEEEQKARAEKEREKLIKYLNSLARDAGEEEFSNGSE